ncbi:MAG: hypothetical protein ABIH83_00770 [Candidatus Micrarchaeota archaeon]
MGFFDFVTNFVKIIGIMAFVVISGLVGFAILVLGSLVFIGMGDSLGCIFVVIGSLTLLFAYYIREKYIMQAGGGNHHRGRNRRRWN